MELLTYKELSLQTGFTGRTLAKRISEHNIKPVSVGKDGIKLFRASDLEYIRFEKRSASTPLFMDLAVMELFFNTRDNDSKTIGMKLNIPASTACKIITRYYKHGGIIAESKLNKNKAYKYSKLIKIIQ